MNPFLGHPGTAHEETGCKSVSVSAECHLELLPRLADIPLQMGQRLGVGSRLLASQISKGLTKDIAVTSKKTATGWIFRQLQGGTFLGPTERKC